MALVADTRRTLAALLAVALAGAVLATAARDAGAIVPPRDCGSLTAKGKRYNIKADQIRCSTARRYSSRYLKTGRRPSGYRCTNYTSGTKLKFRCARGIRTFFAIRR